MCVDRHRKGYCRRMSNSSAPLALLRLIFAAAVAFTLYSAFAPTRFAPHLLPWDKAEHFVAFYVLALLAALALPHTRIVRIGVVLSLLGAAIELAQSIPFVHRDGDVFDWAAETIAILCALCPTVLDKVRSRLREPGI